VVTPTGKGFLDRHGKFILVAIMMLVVSAFSVFVAFAQSDEDTVVSALTGAEETTASAYESVLEAEKEGANVSSLLVQMNVAGQLLAEAQVAYRIGNFGEAVRLAGICLEISERVRNEADDLRIRAYESRVMGFWLTVSGSLVGAFSVGFGGFWGWRVFKRHYYRRVLRMRPEVSSHESR